MEEEEEEEEDEEGQLVWRCEHGEGSVGGCCRRWTRSAINPSLLALGNRMPDECVCCS